MSAVQLQVGDDGILVATMDLPGRPMNVVGDELMLGIARAVERLADPAVKGLVLTSAKADFCAGGDIDRMSKWTRPEQPFEAGNAMKAVLRQMEGQGKPVVAAINGHALGGGLEIALACHARLALDDARLKLGQPEVKLGLLPGGGGTVRLPRLVGIQAALQIMGEGADMSPQQAGDIVHRHQALREMPGGARRGRLPVRVQGKGVHVGAVPAFQRGDQVGAHALRHETQLLVDARVHEPCAAVAAHGPAAHALHAAAHHQVLEAAGHLGGGQVHRLQPAGAEAALRDAGHRFGPLGVEHRSARDIGALLAHRCHAAQHDVVDQRSVERVALLQCLQQGSHQPHRAGLVQAAVLLALAARRAHVVVEVGGGHAVLLQRSAAVP